MQDKKVKMDNLNNEDVDYITYNYKIDRQGINL